MPQNNLRGIDLSKTKTHIFKIVLIPVVCTSDSASKGSSYPTGWADNSYLCALVSLYKAVKERLEALCTLLGVALLVVLVVDKGNTNCKRGVSEKVTQVRNATHKICRPNRK